MNTYTFVILLCAFFAMEVLYIWRTESKFEKHNNELSETTDMIVNKSVFLAEEVAEQKRKIAHMQESIDALYKELLTYKGRIEDLEKSASGNAEEMDELITQQKLWNQGFANIQNYDPLSAIRQGRDDS